MALRLRPQSLESTPLQCDLELELRSLSNRTLEGLLRFALRSFEQFTLSNLQMLPAEITGEQPNASSRVKALEQFSLALGWQ